MRKILLLFVLLCVGTYLSARSLTARDSVDSAVMNAAQQNLHFSATTPQALLIVSLASCDSTGYYMSGTVQNLVKNDAIISQTFDYGDGTSATTEGGHTYIGIGDYTVTYTAVTLLGNTYTASQTVSIKGLPITVSISVHHGAEDTIWAKPDYRDTSFYSITYWAGNMIRDFDNNGWYVIPKESGFYEVYMTTKTGCNISKMLEDYEFIKPPVVDTAKPAPVLTVSLASCDSTGYSISGNVNHLSNNETIVSKSFDYGDGTTGTTDGGHTYTSIGDYRITFTALTSSGNSYTATDSVSVKGLPITVSISVHHGAEDTIWAKPDYRDTSFYSITYWAGNMIRDFDNNGWYVIPKESGFYEVYMTTKTGCNISKMLEDYEFTKPPVVDTAKPAPVLTVSRASCDSTGYSINGGVAHLPSGETVISKSFDYGDGTTGTADGGHTYTSTGNYRITFTAFTSSGNSYTATDSVSVNGLPITVSISIHHGTEDTIWAKPMYRDAATYSITYWAGNMIRDFDNHSWFVIPKEPGFYEVYMTAQNGCNESASIEYYPPVAILNVEKLSCDSTEYAVSGQVDNLESGEAIISKSFDFGDGTIITKEGKHTYTSKGYYTVTYTAVTSLGRTSTATKSVLVTGQPVSVSLSLHHGVQDTIWAKPDYRDASFYQVDWWSANTAKDLDNHSWYVIPTVAGSYGVSLTTKNGCTVTAVLDGYTPPPPPVTEVVAPVANASQLDISADFGAVTFNEDNEFTIELTIKDPVGRTLAETELITLGAVKGTDPASLSVEIPTSLPCASNYSVRVVSSSPADTTNWSGTFAITNQPAQPVITQVGDSLFTNSVYDLQWNKDGVAVSGATNAAIRARANGSYTVTALNGTGCTSTSAAKVVVITAIANVSLGSNTVSAYPNPSEGPVYLKFGYPLTQKVVVKVYNSQGAVMYTTTTIQQQTLLELSTLPKGFYLVEVSGYGTRKVLTIVLQ